MGSPQSNELVEFFDVSMQESDLTQAQPFFYPSGSANVYYGNYNGVTYETVNESGMILNVITAKLVVRQNVLPKQPAIGEVIWKDDIALRVQSVNANLKGTIYTINLTGRSGGK